MIGRLVPAMVLAVALALPARAADPAPVARAPSEAAIRDAVEAAETAHDIQREFPGETGERKVDRAPPLLQPVQQDSEENSWLTKLLEALLPVLRVLAYALLALLAGLLIYAVIRGLLGLRRLPGSEQSAAEEALSINHEAVQDWLREAEGLAARGLHGEAVHRLLLRAIEDLKQRAARGVPQGWTAREVAQNLPLSILARQLLRLLVQVTEQARYAGRAVTADEFIRCRASLEQLLSLRDLRDAA
jgi:hypothetical protein